MKLRDWLIDRGIKQSEFAERLDVGRAHLSCIIGAKRTPGKKLARAIARATGDDITAESILSGEALGYSGKRKRVAECHTRFKDEPCRKMFSLI